MTQEKQSPEHFDESVVGKRFVVAFREKVQQAMKLQVGNELWFYSTEEEGAILVKKAPDNVQKLKKIKKSDEQQ